MYFTSKLDYALKYSEDKVFILSLLVVGNSFPITEHPFITNEKGEIVYEKKPGDEKTTAKRNPQGYYDFSVRTGYQSHFALGFFSFFLFSFFSFLFLFISHSKLTIISEWRFNSICISSPRRCQ